MAFEETTTRPNVYKSGFDKTGSRALPSLGGLSRAVTTGAASVTRAMSAGLETMSEKLTDQNMTAIGLDNGFVAGSFAAASRFFEELAKGSERTFDELLSSTESSRAEAPEPLAPPIDYDRLASLVAEKLRAGQEIFVEIPLPTP